MDMNRLPKEKRNVPGTALLGILTFAAGGFLGSFLIAYQINYLFALPLVGGVGALLLGLLLRQQRRTWKMALAGLVGLPLGLAASFFIIEGVGSILPSLGEALENTIVPDILVVAVMGIVFGLVAGAFLYGPKSLILFGAVCGLAGIPGGIVVGLLNTNLKLQTQLANLIEPFNRFDLNLVVIAASMGLGLGLAFGLFENRTPTKG